MKMAEIAKQIGIFMMALIIIGIPLINGLLVNDTSEKDALDTILTICSMIDLFIVFLLINQIIV